MAALDNLKDMYDVALKPRLLRTLLSEDVPTEKKPFDSPSKLSRVVSLIQTHSLLSESVAGSTDGKLIERWKSAVDDWGNRLLSLVTNTSMPDKCWAGICLLGVTCQECGSDRFLGSYLVWFEKLLLHIQSSANSQFIKVATCTSMSDLITRLAGFPNAKKDGTSLAGKLVQPILKLLKEDSSESVWEGAIHLISTIITFFPASLHRHYDTVEAAIMSNILSGKCSVSMQKKLAHCLALLPKSRGDEDCWVLTMRKILLLVNGYLSDIFYGLEEESKWNEAVRLLVPPGEVPPPSLWGQNLLEETSENARKRSKLSSVSILMHCCCIMLTNSYPVQVTVPVRSLLALVERVLLVDGSLSHTTSSFVIPMEQDFICSELPVLHSYGLELLTSVIKGMRSQLLPHAAYTVRLIKEYFRRCSLPELRIKVYSIIKILLISMGVGIAIYLAQEVVNNSLLDLNPVSDDTSYGANMKPSSEALLQPFHRKRKHGEAGSFEQQHDAINLEMEAPKGYPRSLISVQIAALGALEALLTVGGALRSESWRSKVDNLLITLATDTLKEGRNYEERNTYLPNGSPTACVDLQLAAFHALLASLLSPSRARPPHLAQGLKLFRRGRQDTGTKLSEFCAYALLAMEVLIHPRALPLEDSSQGSISGTVYSGAQNHSAPFSIGMHGTGNNVPDSDDDLYESWIGSSRETEAQVDGLAENVDAEKPLEIFGVEKISVASSSGAKSTQRCDQELKEVGADLEMRKSGDEMMIEKTQFQESTAQIQEPMSPNKGALVSDKVTKMELTRVASDPDVLDLGITHKEIASVEAVTITKDDGIATGAVKPYTSSSTAPKGTSSAHNSGHDSSDDSMPSLFDVDADSDTNSS